MKMLKNGNGLKMKQVFTRKGLLMLGLFDEIEIKNGMTLNQFKINMRVNRGKLTKHDQDMTIIFTDGTPELMLFALDKKLMGVHNIAWIATQPIGYQNRFTNWMAEKNWKADKNELDLWFSQNEGAENG